jgi:predicted transcriptional regulator
MNVAEKSKHPPNLGAVFLALADPVARHMVELIAMAPKSVADLRDHFDFGNQQIMATAQQLEKVGLIAISKGDGDHILFEFHAPSLDLVTNWLDRIASIRN